MTEKKLIDIAPVPGVESHVGLLLASLERGTKEWMGELGKVGPERIVWQPFEGGHSIGALILHNADVEAFWLHDVAAHQPLSAEEAAALMGEQTNQYGVSWPTPPKKPLSWYVERMQSVRSRTLDLIVPMTDPAAEHMHGDTFFTLRWLLHHVITHEAYHGGQAVLLKLMQAKGSRAE